MEDMNKPLAERSHRDIKREIKLTLVSLPVISFLFGVIISFMYVKFASIFKTELSIAVYGALFAIPIFISLIAGYPALKKIFKQIDMMEIVKT
jgi:cobalamin synthase